MAAARPVVPRPGLPAHRRLVAGPHRGQGVSGRPRRRGRAGCSRRQIALIWLAVRAHRRPSSRIVTSPRRAWTGSRRRAGPGCRRAVPRPAAPAPPGRPRAPARRRPALVCGRPLAGRDRAGESPHAGPWRTPGSRCLPTARTTRAHPDRTTGTHPCADDGVPRGGARGMRRGGPSNHPGAERLSPPSHRPPRRRRWRKDPVRPRAPPGGPRDAHRGMPRGSPRRAPAPR